MEKVQPAPSTVPSKSSVGGSVADSTEVVDVGTICTWIEDLADQNKRENALLHLR